MTKKAVVKDYGMAIKLLIDGQGYCMSKTIWEKRVLPEVTKWGYEIKIFQASSHEVARLEDIVMGLLGIPDN